MVKIKFLVFVFIFVVNIKHGLSDVSTSSTPASNVTTKASTSGSTTTNITTSTDQPTNTTSNVTTPSSYCPETTTTNETTTITTTTQPTTVATTTTAKPNITCKENEVVSNCVNKLCKYTNCSQVDKPIECVRWSTEVCQVGCICNDTYLRADNGTCVPYTDCPNYKKCPKTNEYYDLCPSPCIGRICGVGKISSYNCSVTHAADNYTCVPACVCKIGFYRNYDGNCVVESLCEFNTSVATTSTSTTESSTSETTTATTTTTTALTTTTTTTTPTTTSTTPSTQTANSSTLQLGSITTTNGNNSLSNNTVQKCGKNQVYERNPCSLCQPFTCSELGFSLGCTQSNYSSTCSLQPGCICSNGYVRNKNNICIPVAKCPSCGGDVNAESGCRVICPTCNDYILNKTSTACSKLCKLNGCGCKKGYVYNETRKKCELLVVYCTTKIEK